MELPLDLQDHASIWFEIEKMPLDIELVVDVTHARS